MAAFAGECKRRGLWPFVAANRLHVAPPLNIAEDVLQEGLAMIDAALEVADRHVVP
jgi:taurine--2-oxoglutarate transaminase